MQFAFGWKRHLLIVALLIAAFSLRAFGQTPSATAKANTQITPSSFDVVSIKKSSDMNKKEDWYVTKDDGLSLTNVTPKSMIAFAYAIHQDLVEGIPGWAASSGYDVEAKVIFSEGSTSHRLTPRQIELMTQSLLADRFKLVAHTEQRQIPIFELIVAKGGPKLKEAKPGDDYAGGLAGPNNSSGANMVQISDGQFVGQGIAVSRLAAVLSRVLHQPVVDNTGLKGSYDITIPMAITNGTNLPSDESVPTLFITIEDQLGLKLRSTKGPGTVLVVDHISPPSQN